MNDVTVVVAPDIKRPQVETLLADVFKLMEYPAKLEFKDMSDGSLGVAVHFDGELPGITAGKRSYLVDSVQFWLNKVVNRPNVPRRWVNLGVNAFPEPRQPGQPQMPMQAPPASAPAQPAARPAAAVVSKDSKDRTPAAGKPRASTPPPPAAAARPVSRGGHADERALTPAADPLMSAAGKLLAEKAAKLGRVYGVMGLSADQRALMLKAAEGLKGVTAKAEGDGHWRRLVMVPEKLAVIAKKQVMPDYDDEDE